MSSPIDTHKVKQLIGDQETLLHSILLMFANDLTEHVMQLQALHTEIDAWPSYQRLLHRLLGSASYFGTDDLRAVLLEAEACRRNQDRDALNTVLTRVYHEVERILHCELMLSATHAECSSC